MPLPLISAGPRSARSLARCYFVAASIVGSAIGSPSAGWTTAASASPRSAGRSWCPGVEWHSTAPVGIVATGSVAGALLVWLVMTSSFLAAGSLRAHTRNPPLGPLGLVDEFRRAPGGVVASWATGLENRVLPMVLGGATLVLGVVVDRRIRLPVHEPEG